MLLYFRNLLNTSIRRVHGAPLATLDPSHDVRNLLLCLNASNIRKHHKTMTVTSTPSTQQNMKLSLILKVSSLPSPTLNISIAPLAPWAGGCCASTCEEPNPRPKLDDCRPLSIHVTVLTWGKPMESQWLLLASAKSPRSLSKNWIYHWFIMVYPKLAILKEQEKQINRCKFQAPSFNKAAGLDVLLHILPS